MTYDLAWVVIGVAGLLGTGFLIFLTRNFSSPSLRWIIRLLPLLLMVVPAPVPNFQGQFAPAFVVLIFESLFQAEGEPGTAGLMLLVAALTALILGALVGRAVGRAPTEVVAPDQS